MMKLKTFRLTLPALVSILAILLTACGASDASSEASSNGTSAEAAQGSAEQAEQTVEGTINRLGDYLVLITEEGEYQVMDFSKDFSAEGFDEGDDVVITYAGALGNEEEPPVIIAMERAQE